MYIFQAIVAEEVGYSGLNLSTLLMCIRESADGLSRDDTGQISHEHIQHWSPGTYEPKRHCYI